MKLRNKKTGKVAEIYLDNYTATNFGVLGWEEQKKENENA